MVKRQVLLTFLLAAGMVNQNIHAIKPQHWAFATAGGTLVGAATAVIIHHYTRNKPLNEKPKLKALGKYMGISALGGLVGGALTGTLGYFFTPYYRLSCGKNRVDQLRTCYEATHRFGNAQLFHTHINENSPDRYPLAATFIDLTCKKTMIDTALDYLTAAKKDTSNPAMLNDVQQTENMAQLMQTNIKTHIRYLREHPQFQQQVTTHRAEQREEIHLRNETTYAQAARTSADAMQTSANAQMMHGASDAARTFHYIFKH